MNKHLGSELPSEKTFEFASEFTNRCRNGYILKFPNLGQSSNDLGHISEFEMCPIKVRFEKNFKFGSKLGRFFLEESSEVYRTHCVHHLNSKVNSNGFSEENLEVYIINCVQHLNTEVNLDGFSEENSEV